MGTLRVTHCVREHRSQSPRPHGHRDMLCTDVILAHVIPKCSIDTRLAFRVKPRKLDMASFEQSLAGLAWKHGPEIPRAGRTPADSYRQFVPLWQFGKREDGFPKEYFFIWLLTNLRKHPGSTRYGVYRERSDSANKSDSDCNQVFIHPTPYTLQYGYPYG